MCMQRHKNARWPRGAPYKNLIKKRYDGHKRPQFKDRLFSVGLSTNPAPLVCRFRCFVAGAPRLADADGHLVSGTSRRQTQVHFSSAGRRSPRYASEEPHFCMVADARSHRKPRRSSAQRSGAVEPPVEPKGIELIRLATPANRSRGSRVEGGREK
jgi:hypothetical protein